MLTFYEKINNIIIRILRSKLTFEVFTSVNIKIVFFRNGEPCGLAVHPDRNIVLPKIETAKFLLNFGTSLSNHTSLQP